MTSTQFITPSASSNPAASFLRLYGIAGDGITDDTAALQACLNANVGSVVTLPPATYRLTSTLFVSDGTTLQGSGYNTILALDTTSAAGVLLYYQGTVYPASAQPNKIIIRDLKLTGGKSGCAGLRLDFAVGARLQNVWCDSVGGTGFPNFCGISPHYTNCRATRNGFHGFYSQGSGGTHATNAVYVSCEAFNNGLNGFEAFTTDTAAWIGCVSEANVRGFNLNSASSAGTIMGCHVENNSTEQITVGTTGPCIDNRIIASTYSYTTQTNITINQATNTMLDGVFATGGAAGVTITASATGTRLLGVAAVIADSGVGTIRLDDAALKLATGTKLGFYGAALASQPTSHGTITAGASYTANEQNMLNDVYAALRLLGLMA